MSDPASSVRPTQRDLARALGVTQATVSRALRDDPRLPASRRQEIQTAAAKIGYQPDPNATALARFMRTARSQPTQAAMGWLNIWPDPKQLRRYREFDGYWRGAELAAKKFGYRLEEFVINREMPLQRVEKILWNRNVNGLLIPPAGPTMDPGSLRELHWERFCAVRFGHTMSQPTLHLVTADQVGNCKLAFDQMRGRGYERIGFVTGSNSFQRMLFKAGILLGQSEISPECRVPALVLDDTAPAATHPPRLRDWLGRWRPDGILTEVPSCHEMLKAIGCRVPEDVGLAALSVLDGNADAGISQNPEEIGRVAALVVISLLQDNARGIPPIFRQVLIAGAWVDGRTLPPRRAAV